MNLIVHAPNVHQGGGRVLLLALLRALDGRHPYCAQLNARFADEAELAHATVLIRVEPSIAQRLAAEVRLCKLAQAGDRVLCFGNLPPLFRQRGRVILYLQNRYLIGATSTAGFAVTVRMRIAAERLWLKSRIRTVDSVLVQTPSMQREAEKQLGMRVRVMSFVPQPATTGSRGGMRPNTAHAVFLYVASGEPHKNHARLIEAWRLLAMDDLRPTLWLTLDPQAFPALVELAELGCLQHGLDIRNAGAASATRLAELYREADALIYPSTMESLGLPLIEARGAGLPILAAERDYVRDVADPEQSFDPESPMSIARAVRRFLEKPEARESPLSPGEFVRRLLAPDD